MRPFLALALLLCLPAPGRTQGGAFRVQSEACVTLSLAQEAEEAIDRAQRWLAAHPPANDRATALLQRYAQSGADHPFRIARCDLTPLEQAMPPALPESAWADLAATLQSDAPRTLFALQRDLPLADATPPSDWRETLVRTLVNTQKVDADGGHWQTREDTVWAVLTLRALLNASPPIDLL